MAKAIFHKPVGYTQAKGGTGWHADPSPEPQSFPREFIDYAVAAGAATLVDQGGDPAEEPADKPAKK